MPFPILGLSVWASVGENVLSARTSCLQEGSYKGDSPFPEKEERGQLGKGLVKLGLVKRVLYGILM